MYPDNKGKWSRAFADRHGVSYGHILAVGDSVHGDGNLGHLKANKFGIAKDRAEKEKLLEVMGAAAVTEDFGPVIEWLKRKIED